MVIHQQLFLLTAALPKSIACAFMTVEKQSVRFYDLARWRHRLVDVPFASRIRCAQGSWIQSVILLDLTSQNLLGKLELGIADH